VHKDDTQPLTKTTENSDRRPFSSYHCFKFQSLIKSMEHGLVSSWLWIYYVSTTICVYM